MGSMTIEMPATGTSVGAVAGSSDRSLEERVARAARAARSGQELREGESGDLRRRRAVVTLSLVSAASMAAVSLLQTGVVRHLPDPPLPRFDSDRVNLSETAYAYGVADGPLGVVSAAANLPLAALGGADRARERPWVPLLAAAKAAVEAVAAGWYFYQMPAREKRWCGYCIVGALANWGIFALTVPEAACAIAALRSRRTGARV